MNVDAQIQIRQRIEQLMEELDISSRASFADEIGINRSNFYQSMKGEERTIGETIINKIALTYGVSREWLMTGIGEMYNSMESKKMKELLGSYTKLVDAHVILVKNSETLTNTNKELVDQNKVLFAENKDLRDSLEILMKELK